MNIKSSALSRNVVHSTSVRFRLISINHLPVWLQTRPVSSAGHLMPQCQSHTHTLICRQQAQHVYTVPLSHIAHIKKPAFCCFWWWKSSITPNLSLGVFIWVWHSQTRQEIRTAQTLWGHIRNSTDEIINEAHQWDRSMGCQGGLHMERQRRWKGGKTIQRWEERWTDQNKLKAKGKSCEISWILTRYKNKASDYALQSGPLVILVPNTVFYIFWCMSTFTPWRGHKRKRKMTRDMT